MVQGGGGRDTTSCSLSKEDTGGGTRSEKHHFIGIVKDQRRYKDK